jgi:hypothetical protein
MAGRGDSRIFSGSADVSEWDYEKSHAILKIFHSYSRQGEGLEEKGNMQKIHIPKSYRPVTYFSMDGIISLVWSTRIGEGWLEKIAASWMSWWGFHGGSAWAWRVWFGLSVFVLPELNLASPMR